MKSIEGFKLAQSSLMMIYCDYRSTISMTDNLVFHGRTNHSNIHHHFICDQIGIDLNQIKSCSTKDQVIDIFMKALKLFKFH